MPDDSTEFDEGYEAPKRAPVRDRNPLTEHLGADDPHAAPEDKEEVYYEGSPLLRGEWTLLAGWVAAAVVIVAIGVGVVYWTEFSLTGWLVGLIMLAVGVGCVFFPALWVRRLHYRITNYRIDFEHGLLSKNIETLELWHVNDIRFHQSLLDRIFGVGTIGITSDDRSTPELDLRSIKDPRPLFDILKQRVISIKRQRGVIKMDMGG
ncbi:MAG: PH domain-containing protein [Planctomycetota bacterium]